jgi:hypothetical protein
VQKAQETPILTGMAGFQYSNTEACRCNNICHRARFHGFKIEKHMCLSGFTVYYTILVGKGMTTSTCWPSLWPQPYQHPSTPLLTQISAITFTQVKRRDYNPFFCCSYRRHYPPPYFFYQMSQNENYFLWHFIKRYCILITMLILAEEKKNLFIFIVRSVMRTN